MARLKLRLLTSEEPIQGHIASTGAVLSTADLSQSCSSVSDGCIVCVGISNVTRRLWPKDFHFGSESTPEAQYVSQPLVQVWEG